MPERRRSLLARLFPRQADNRFDGHRAALWLLGLFVALKLVVGLNSILDTEAVAAGADGCSRSAWRCRSVPPAAGAGPRLAPGRAEAPARAIRPLQDRGDAEAPIAPGPAPSPRR